MSQKPHARSRRKVVSNAVKTAMSVGRSKSQWVLPAIVAACIGSVGVALLSQYFFDMQPCPWCVLQRAIFLTIALVCAWALIWRNTVGRMSLCSLAFLLALSGIASALWQHFKAAVSISCNFTLADKIITASRLDRLLPGVFAPRSGCADAKVNLLGIPYEFWSLALFFLIAGALAWIIAALNRTWLGER